MSQVILFSNDAEAKNLQEDAALLLFSALLHKDV